MCPDIYLLYLNRIVYSHILITVLKDKRNAFLVFFGYLEFLKAQVFISFQVQDINGFWEYVEGPLLDGLHWEYWYNTGDNRST